MSTKPPYLWDYNIDEEKFKEILGGKTAFGRLDWKWAMIRLMEYASYPEIIRQLGFKKIVERWPHLRHQIRSQSRKRGFDFLVDWLVKFHPEKITK
ncbi:MAG: hypothetical protein ACYDBV_13270 [Nitrospiria bacterium]